MMESEQLIGGKYKLAQKLGKGAYGAVYKAFYKDKFYAVKIITKESTDKFKFLEKYIKGEARIQKSLSHPNIVKLYEFINMEKSYVFVLEYCKEESLKHIIERRKKPMEYLEAIEIVRQVIRGIVVVHEKGIIHRDIKLQNILAARDDAGNMVYKIADFGFSTCREIGQSYCGTLKYMAPEIISRDTYNNKADVWAIGVLCFCMLFLETPFNNIEEIEKYCVPEFSLQRRLAKIKNSRLKIDDKPELDQFFRQVFVIDYDQRISSHEMKSLLLSLGSQAESAQYDRHQEVINLETQNKKLFLRVKQLQHQKSLLVQAVKELHSQFSSYGNQDSDLQFNRDISILQSQDRHILPEKSIQERLELALKIIEGKKVYDSTKEIQAIQKEQIRRIQQKQKLQKEKLMQQKLLQQKVQKQKQLAKRLQQEKEKARLQQQQRFLKLRDNKSSDLQFNGDMSVLDAQNLVANMPQSKQKLTATKHSELQQFNGDISYLNGNITKLTQLQASADQQEYQKMFTKLRVRKNLKPVKEQQDWQKQPQSKQITQEQRYKQEQLKIEQLHAILDGDPESYRLRLSNQLYKRMMVIEFSDRIFTAVPKQPFKSACRKAFLKISCPLAQSIIAMTPFEAITSSRDKWEAVLTLNKQKISSFVALYERTANEEPGCNPKSDFSDLKIQLRKEISSVTTELQKRDLYPLVIRAYIMFLANHLTSRTGVEAATFKPFLSRGHDWLLFSKAQLQNYLDQASKEDSKQVYSQLKAMFKK